MPVTYDPSDKMNKKTSVSTNLFLCSKFTIPSILCYLYAHVYMHMTLWTLLTLEVCRTLVTCELLNHLQHHRVPMAHW